MSVSKWEMKKLFHVLQLKYTSIEADLIYASENLAAFSQREEQQKELHWHFREAYLYQDNFAKAATTLESYHGRELFSSCNS
jgi:hypothetical protein